LTTAALLTDRELGLFQNIVPAARLETSSADALRWVAPYFASGVITAVSGAPKEAGKSTFVLHAVKAVTEGGSFLGQATQQGSVIYFTEESDATIIPTVRRLGMRQSERLHLVPRRLSQPYSLPEIVRAAVARAAQNQAVMLVIDTLAHFATLNEGQEQDAGVMTAVLKTIQPAADAGLAVALIVHDIKSKGQQISRMRGSNALAAAVDSVLSIRPVGRGPSRVRSLTFTSRGLEIPDTPALVELTSDGYVRVGTDQSVHSSRRRRESSAGFRLRLPEAREKAMTIDQIARKHRLPHTTVREELERMTAAGCRIEKTNRGVRGKPTRYWSFVPASDAVVERDGPTDRNETDGQIEQSNSRQLEA